MENETIKEILKNEGVVSIVAKGEEFPHIVNTWNSSVVYDKDKLSLPVGGMKKMEDILKQDNRVIIVIGSKEVEGLHGAGNGAGYKIYGKAKIDMDTQTVARIQKKFGWARGVMNIDITEAYQTT